MSRRGPRLLVASNRFVRRSYPRLQSSHSFATRKHFPNRGAANRLAAIRGCSLHRTASPAETIRNSDAVITTQRKRHPPNENIRFY